MTELLLSDINNRNEAQLFVDAALGAGFDLTALRLGVVEVINPSRIVSEYTRHGAKLVIAEIDSRRNVPSFNEKLLIALVILVITVVIIFFINMH